MKPCPDVLIKVTKFKIALGFNVFIDRNMLKNVEV